jgi:predicted nucleic acid-binding Zn ribbon protein
MLKTIEDIILQHDKRGISKLSPFLPKDFCGKAANTILNNKGTVFITTGFYILKANAPETDGPLGAIAIGNALEKLGYNVFYVADFFSFQLFIDIIESEKVIIFPICSDKESEVYAKKLIKKFSPSLMITVERCGATAKWKYLNMKGVDISDYNAKVDHLFYNHNNTIGIGDGGNEIGMGNLCNEIKNIPELPNEPCTTKVSNLIISSVSNWGAYGLVAALAQKTGIDLLPTIEEERNLLEKIVINGAVDGITRETKAMVDGFEVEEYLEILSELQLLIGK